MCPFDPRKEQDPQSAGVEMEPSIREKHGGDGWDRKRERECYSHACAQAPDSGDLKLPNMAKKEDAPKPVRSLWGRCSDHSRGFTAKGIASTSVWKLSSNLPTVMCCFQPPRLLWQMISEEVLGELPPLLIMNSCKDLLNYTSVSD